MHDDELCLKVVFILEISQGNHRVLDRTERKPFMLISHEKLLYGLTLELMPSLILALSNKSIPSSVGHIYGYRPTNPLKSPERHGTLVTSPYPLRLVISMAIGLLIP